jgi:DNA-binding transcriptional LysR family regulator
MRMTLDLRLLTAFIAVAETENVAQAAERLHISQSPLSRQIIQLEAQLGLQLFERTRQRIRLTDEGRLFLQEARGLIAHASAVQAAARTIAQGETGHIAVGYVEGAMHSSLLPRALARLQSAQPSATFELQPMGSAKQIEALHGRVIDFGLVYSPPESPDIEFIEVSSEALMLVMGRHHELATQADISAQDLHGKPWVTLARAKNPAARQRFLQNCSASGFLPDVRAEADDLLSVLRLVACGLGLTVVQASLADLLTDSLVYREIPWYPVRIKVYAIWRKGDAKPLVAAFRQALLATAI